MTALTRPAVALALILTLALGVVLRFFLAGHPLGLGDFHHLRHAHSHLGYYGFLFPLVWRVWRNAGIPQPGPRVFIAYGLATAAATLGFWVGGYNVVAIVGSAVVGLGWVISALWTRVFPWNGRWGWLSSGPAGVLVAGILIPPIAIITQRDPLRAAEWVHTFLSLLIFLVFLPAALHRIGLPLRHPLWVWVAALPASVHAGLYPHLAFGLGFVGYAALLAGGLWQKRMQVPALVAVQLGFLAVGLLFFGLGLLPENASIAVAGFHFIFLGPVVSVAGLARPGIPRFLLWAQALLVMAFAAAIVGTTFAATAYHASQTAAWLGVAVALITALLAGVAVWRWRDIEKAEIPAGDAHDHPTS
jgi:hypothetical protein